MRIGIVIGFLVALFLSTGAALGADSQRERLLLDWNWQFQLGDPPEVGTSLDYPEIKDLAKARKADVHAEEQLAATRPSTTGTHVGENLSIVKPGFDASSWRKLDLPHDWAVELPFDPKANYGHGFKDLDPKKNTTVGWYRRTFSLGSADKGRTLTVEFDGVYRNSLVWLNGHILGRHPSGYTSFEYDIGKYANCGDGDAGKNTLVVRVDATRTEGWFYEGAGIYRHVWLTKREPIHVARWGTYVTSVVSDAGAEISIETGLRNNNDETGGISLTSTIVDADGKSLAELTTGDITLATNKTNTIKQKISVPSPRLWSPETPYLYKLVSTVKKGDKVEDVLETSFGIRTVTFDPNQGMFLNGKHIELYGTCNHQDHAGVGAAIPDSLQTFRLERLKDFGCNAIRTSHNEPTPELLDACDRLGILVMDENRRIGTDKESTAEMESLILRDRNHPSVFIWSVGNEETLQGDETDGVAICKNMQDVCHRLDPSRKCTVAMNNAWGLGFSNVIDVIGFNYAARKTRNGISVDEYHAKYPDRPMIGTEDASTVCTRGVYGEDSDGNISADIVDPKNAKLPTDPELKRKGYVPAYDTLGTATAAKWWNFFADRPFLPGSFVWTGFDYRGEPTPYKWPCINSHFGVLDTCGFPKDIFYYYQACWTNKPVVHLLPQLRRPAPPRPFNWRPTAPASTPIARMSP